MKFLIALLVVLATVDAAKIPMEKALVSENPHLLNVGPAMATQTHDVVFSVKQRNIDQIEKILLDVSTPGSTNYGKHMTRAQVADLTANPAATQAIKDYLAANGAEVVKATQYGEYITARANIATWEKLFDTKFYLFKDIYNSKTGPIFRSLEYSIDESLVDHVGAVFGTSQLPTHMNPRSSYRKVSEAALAGTITPAQINSYYNVTSNKGNSLASQAVFETIGQTYSEPDLAMFESQYNIPAEKVAVDIGGFESDTLCQTDVNSCVEANLDVQYLIAVSQVTPTTYWYEAATDSFLAWITAVADSSNPPLVNSISYGSTESSLPSSLTTQFNTEAAKLGVLGVTVFVSSGDDGAAGSGARNAPKSCAYQPSFPATSPYVTAVGATQGPESNTAEVVCSSKTKGVITSGGGFSTKYAAPSWQTAAIAGYFKVASPAPVSGYAATGRGYPDLSLAGLDYNVVVGLNTYAVSGTSASSPTLAAFVSLINAGRLAANKPALGFLNPSIYSLHAAFEKDVTVGDNLCTAGANCCTQGYYAAPGWDPATGFGSVNFGKFYDTLFNL